MTFAGWEARHIASSAGEAALARNVADVEAREAKASQLQGELGRRQELAGNHSRGGA